MYRLIPLNTKNKFHRYFTYSLLKDKYNNDNIIINSALLPTFEQHIKTLNEFPFHCFYLISFMNIIYGEMFVDKNMKFGIYTKRSRFKKILRLYKEHPLIKNRNLTISNIPFELMIKAHPEIKKLYADININNSLSILGAEKLEFKKKYIIMEFNRNE